MDISYYKKYEPIDGKWYITRELGSGSFGTVFEIQRKDFPDMKSALKIISIPNSQNEVRSYREENYDLDDQSVTSYFYGFVEEFVKEFKLMSKLKGNSNIVSYEDHDIKKHENGIGWDILIRMELLTPLGEYLAQNKPDADTVIKLGIDICKALEVCQKHNIIHRDIKPSNIFVSGNGDFKLGDFGVARTLEKTSSGLSKKGTYTYMAPEVYKGEKYNSDVDIYSLGILMYKLLNNNMEPFRTNKTYSDGEKALAMRMSGEKIPAPSQAEGRLAEVVLKACSYNPKERYENSVQMRTELEKILNNKEESSAAYLGEDRSDYEVSEINSAKETTVSMFSDDVIENDTDGIFAEENKINETVSVFSDERSDAQEKSNGICCSNCGSVNTDGQNFCMYCGAALNLSKQADINVKGKEKKEGISKVFGNFIADNKKILAISALSLVAAIAAVFGILKLIGGINDKTAGIELYPDAVVTAEQLKSIEKEVESRAKVINKGAKVEIDDKKLLLRIDETAMGENPTVRKQNLNWIQTKGDIHIYSTVSYSESSFGKESFKEIAIENISVSELEKYKKYFYEKKYNDLTTNITDAVSVIKVKLDDGAKVYFNDMIEAVEAKLEGEMYTTSYDNTPLQLVTDIKEFDGSTVVGTVVPIQDNDGDFYIVSQAAFNTQTVELINKVLNEKSELDTWLTSKVMYKPKWEEDTANFGRNQVANLEGKNIIIKFTPDDYNVDNYSKNDIDKYVDLIKKRLDTLGSPYAIGFKGIDYKTVLIKIPPSKLISDSCKMLMNGRGVAVHTQYKRLDTGIKAITVNNKDSITVAMNGNKNTVISEYNKTSAQLSDEQLTEVDALFDDTGAENADEQKSTQSTENQSQSGVLYLLVNDTTIAQADLQDMNDDGTIEFKKFLCFEHDNASQEEAYMFDLISQIYSEDSPRTVLRGAMEVLYYDGDTELENEKIDWLFDSLNDYDRQTIRTIEKLGHTVEKSGTARSTLIITLDIEINDDMPKKFTDAVKEIYNACDFDDGSYSWIFFKIKNECNNHPDDRCRLAFNKASYNDLEMTANLLVDGPTFEKYSSDFEEILERDEFFKTKREM